MSAAEKAAQEIDAAIARATGSLSRDEYIEALEELLAIVEARLDAARSDPQ